MIHIFNRAELLTTFDVARQAQACNILAANQIDYRVKVLNRATPPGGFGSRARTRTPYQNYANQYEYIIYVKKSDLDAAAHLIRG